MGVGLGWVGVSISFSEQCLGMEICFGIGWDGMGWDGMGWDGMDGGGEKGSVAGQYCYLW